DEATDGIRCDGATDGIRVRVTEARAGGRETPDGARPPPRAGPVNPARGPGSVGPRPPAFRALGSVGRSVDGPSWNAPRTRNAGTPRTDDVRESGRSWRTRRPEAADGGPSPSWPGRGCCSPAAARGPGVPGPTAGGR